MVHLQLTPGDVGRTEAIAGREVRQTIRQALSIKSDFTIAVEGKAV